MVYEFVECMNSLYTTVSLTQQWLAMHLEELHQIFKMHMGDDCQDYLQSQKGQDMIIDCTFLLQPINWEYVVRITFRWIFFLGIGALIGWAVVIYSIMTFSINTKEKSHWHVINKNRN